VVYHTACLPPSVSPASWRAGWHRRSLRPWTRCACGIATTRSDSRGPTGWP